ncbi:MAG: hypothetical protein WC763_02540 [Candidatus Paceibacterota bacterium]
MSSHGSLFANRRCEIALTGPFKFGQVCFRRNADNPGVIEKLFYDKGGMERGPHSEGGQVYENHPGFVSLEEFRVRKEGRSRHWRKARGKADFLERHACPSVLRGRHPDSLYYDGCHPHACA